MNSTTKTLHPGVRLVHWVIIINLVIQIAYGSYMTFVVMAPPGGSGPLFGAAGELPFEHMMTRRLYASETWIAIVGLSLYLGITEVLPRVLRSSSGDQTGAG